MKRLLFALLSLVPIALLGQNAITGIVLDSLTQEPLPSATVYINGTTQGTATDADGRFELKDVSYPATIVFSFVGYMPQAIDLYRNPGTLTIGLKTNDILPEVVVSGKANKVDKKDLEYFKTIFLGDDKWGQHAIIKNENVLIADRSVQTSYKIRRIGRSSYSTRTISADYVEKHEEYYDTVKVRKSVFSAWATEPLIIDLPLLGYEVYVDLVYFNVERTNTITQYDMLGYFYYKPYEQLKKRQARSIEENRKKAYYGSSQHFLRSLAEDRLTENGYLLSTLDEVKKNKKVINMYMPVDIKKYSYDAGGYYMQIRGLKDKNLRIRYYYKNDGSPWIFSDKGKGIRRYSESKITFLKDTCTFQKDGIAIDNSIRFTGELSKKRVASSLPDDYFPYVDSSMIKVVDYESELLKFADNIREFNSMFPQEKVYLEFDNTAYFQGENIWFKAFVTHATTLERAPSGVLYVDFLAPTGQLILQQKLKIVAGQADGAIPLLDAGTMQTREKQGILAYPSGFYEIRAYTQNMLDFSPEAIFSRVIPVYTQPKYEGEYDRSRVETNIDNSLTEDLRGKSKVKINDVNITLYPEGGDLIKGLPCRVAFKATGSDAFGIDGALVVPGVWDSVFTVHDGMGSFIITPKESEPCVFTSSNGKSVRTSLPKIINSGYSMISDVLSDSQLQVNIWRTPDRIGEKTALAVTCRGEVIHFEEIKNIENSQLEIDCSEWPVGVCRVTLFNKDGMILSSRSIFHYSSDLQSPTITLNTDSMSRQSCDKEVIELQLTDQDGNPFRDRFCLSVRDATDYGGGQTDNLQTNLLLSSDLRGYIHDPAWYLESDDEEHREALNLLTMVQGWERYEWQTMTGLKEFEEKHRVEESLTMNGWILSYSKREPVSDIGVYASIIPDDDKKLFESFDYQTDSTGYFGFDLSDFYGNGKFTINLMSTKKDGESKYEKSKRIRFERADRPQPRPFLKQETDLNHNDHRPYDYKVDYTDFDLTPAQRRKLGRMIDDVDIEESSSKRRFIDYDTFTSFEAEEDSELELDQGEYTTDVQGYFLERGIRFSQDEAGQIIGGNEESEESVSTASDTNLRPLFYVHNLEKLLTHKPFDSALHIDMIDVKSIIVYDKPMYPRDFQDLIPLMNDWVKKHAGATPPEVPVKDAIFNCPDLSYWCWLDNCWKRYTLVDIQIKEDRELLFYSEIRNLGRRTTTVKGFTSPVQYYSPVYPDGPIEGIVDTRRTLYWNANVITDEDGHARVEFYNNSFTRKFTINAAGITASGIPYILQQNW
ncbi:MAG: carboxypeptidase-like regulatory domain-containing protein [Bacteroidaceae bacterium]|nr:carboxypeptidase-like regulatory domain-containing protein [Bacteroidaceae bacterium]